MGMLSSFGSWPGKEEDRQRNCGRTTLVGNASHKRDGQYLGLSVKSRACLVGMQNAGITSAELLRGVISLIFDKVPSNQPASPPKLILLTLKWVGRQLEG